MATLAGFLQSEIEFDRSAALLNPETVTAFFDDLAQTNVTDLLVFSHGWNNDTADARALNAALFTSVRGVLEQNLPALASLSSRKLAVLTVLWPSKRFTDAELIPGGAAAVGGPSPGQARLLQQVEDMKRLYPKDPAAAKALDAAKGLVPRLENEPRAQQQFVDTVRNLMTKAAPDPEDAADQFLRLPGDEMLKLLQGPAAVTPTGPGLGGAAGIGGAGTLGGTGTLGRAGGAVGLGDFFGGIISGAQQLMNLTTYYEMKNRAGQVGAALGSVLATLGQGTPKLHLIGHSFGGRVAAATATALAGGNTPVRTLTLLQAAFSHYGFAEKYDNKRDGVFRIVLTEKVVTGPVLITCTSNDKAVGLAYPLASRIARQVGSAIGDANDRYGGLGRNGAQKTPEAKSAGRLLGVGGTYAFHAGAVFNLQADEFIKDHGDITGAEVAYALLTGVAAT